MNRSENQTIRRFIFSTLLFPQLQTLHGLLYKRWIEKRFCVVVLDSLGIEALVKAADHTFDAGFPRHGYTADGHRIVSRKNRRSAQAAPDLSDGSTQRSLCTLSPCSCERSACPQRPRSCSLPLSFGFGRETICSQSVARRHRAS